MILLRKLAARFLCPRGLSLVQLEDDLLYKLSSAEGDMTEDLALIESLEESKRVADEISEKVAEAKTTEEQINEARNKVTLLQICSQLCQAD